MKEELIISNETTLRLPEHQLLLDFNNDSGVETFENWWWEEGKGMFGKYCLKEEK